MSSPNHWAGNCPECGAAGIGSKRLINTLFIIKCFRGHTFLKDSYKDYKDYTKPIEHQFKYMDEIQYTNMVNRLAKDGGEILNSCTPNKIHLLHMAVGLSGEVAELFEAMNKPNKDFENILEECGDIEFYFEGYHQGVGLQNNYAPSLPLIRKEKTNWHKSLTDLVIAAGDLLDATKKVVFYDQAPDITNIRGCLARIGRIKLELYSAIGLSQNDAQNHNIRKLSKRYKDFNYSDEQAKERADKK